jgi:CubicO group peptidase (beta-lactamase class C family)
VSDGGPASMAEIQGRVDPRFERVREAFAENFDARDEVGAGVAVFVDGRQVVSLQGGHADQARARRWRPDTLVNVYSTTKAMTAICAHRLVEQGRLELDAPVARYWPEFAAAGKGELLVRWLLSHRAGLAAVEAPLPPEALYDWDAMCAALAAQRPWWTPGDDHGYHAITFGWLVGELVRRIDGRSLGRYFREEVAGPLGADFWIGLPDSEHARVGELSAMPLPQPGEPEGASLAATLLSDPEGLAARAFLNPPSVAAGPNQPEWRRAEIPGANGHATADGIARVYSALACGGRADDVHVLAPESIERCREPQSRGPDRVLGISTRFGQGFMLSQDEPLSAFGPSPGAFGHPGAGGSVGFADPHARVGFGYVMNRMGPHILLDPRARTLIDAAYTSL